MTHCIPIFQGSTEVLDEKCDTSDKESVDSATGSSTSKEDSPVRKRQMLKKGTCAVSLGVDFLVECSNCSFLLLT